MKVIFSIIKTELQKLFYSPVAWLIIIIFCFQAGLLFTRNFGDMVHDQSLGFRLDAITASLYSVPVFGMMMPVLSYLYLYVPLLTMGVISQEYSSGSVKLLYSSPVTNWQMIIGKYLALVICALVMVSILAVYMIFTFATVVHVEWPLLVSCLLGMFLLVCTYAAVGLFVSSLTSYTVVAAMGTLGIFALLNYLKGLGQSIKLVRDITYWIGLTGRANNFVQGIISTEDILYFLLITGMFLAFTLIRIQSVRQKTTRARLFIQYGMVVVCALAIGYCSALPSMKKYLDVTENKRNTLPPSGQAVIGKLKGPLKITTYVNMLDANNWFFLPNQYKEEENRFSRYLRFKPDIRLEYVYYYHNTENKQLDEQYSRLNEKQRMDTLQKLQDYKFDIVPYQAIAGQVDLQPEGFRSVRLLEAANGKKTFLRLFNDDSKLPSDREIIAAFKRLTTNLPTVGFLTGHGERESNNKFDKGLNLISGEKRFRYAFINQGLDFENVVLNKPVPAHIRMLIIAAMRKPLADAEVAFYNEFIQRGGNVILMGEPGSETFMNPLMAQLGVQFTGGTLVRHSAALQPGLLAMAPTDSAARFSPQLEFMKRYGYQLVMPKATGIAWTGNTAFKRTVLFSTDSSTLVRENNLGEDLDTSAYTGSNGVLQTYPTVVALSREINNRQQKIMVTSDADWLGNGELLMNRQDILAANYSVISAAFYWMSGGEVPVDMQIKPTTDAALRIAPGGWEVASFLLKWMLPLLLLFIAIIIWIRRRGR